MEKFETQAFLESLTPEQREAVQNCKTTEELEEVMDKYDIALPEEMLEEIAGGRGGRLIASILAAITIVSAGTSITASAATSSTAAAASASASADDSSYDPSFLGIDGDKIVEYEKKLANMGIDKGIDALAEYIPVVGKVLKGPLKNLIKDALGTKSKSEPKLTLKDISEQIKGISKQIEGLETSLENSMDKNTLKLIDELNNLDTMSKYKDGIFDLSLSENECFRKISTIDKYNKDEQLVILAESIGNSQEWSNTDNIVNQLHALNKMLTGNNYLDKKNFYTVLCDSKMLQKDALFYSEVQSSEGVQTYVARMMTDYYATYAVVTQAINAQKTIIDAVQNGDLETFNPDNIRSYTLKDWYEKHFSTLESSIPGEVEDLQKELCGTSKRPECVISNYEQFAAGGRKEYINNGNEKTELVFSARTVSAEKNIFESIFKSNYLTGDKLKYVLTAASSKGMSVADYLASVNNPLPEDAQYLIVDTDIKREIEKTSTDGGKANYIEHITDKITVVDVNDPTQKWQNMPVYSYSHEKRYGIGSSDFYYNYKFYPMNVLNIQEVNQNDSNPLGEMEDRQYKLNSGTYRLSKDTFTNGTIVIRKGCNVTIDMNGFSVNRMLTNAEDKGSVIIVEDGGYLNLIDSSMSGKSVLKGGYSKQDGGGIRIEKGGEARLQGVKICENKTEGDGGAIYSNGKLTLINSTLDGNTAKNGGGIYNSFLGTIDSSNGTKITNNTASEQGGGIWNKGTVKMVDYFDISGNTADGRGGGIYTTSKLDKMPDGTQEYHGHIFLDDGRISGNKSGSHGGGIEFDRPVSYEKDELAAVLNKVLIEDNTADEKGGGINFSMSGFRSFSVNMDDCQIFGNTAHKQGGGIAVSTTHGGDNYYCTLNINNNEIKYNHADKDGGGIYSTYHGFLNIEDTNIDTNESDEDGGGIYAQGSLTIKSGTINTNTAAVDGGGICYNQKWTYGISVTNTDLEGNECNTKEGGKGNGAGIWYKSDGGLMKLHYVTLSSNVGAYDGGGVYAQGSVQLKECQVCNNEASNKGGGLNIDKKGCYLEFISTKVYNNSAPKGEAFRFHEGAKYYYKQDTVVEGSVY